MLLDLFKWFSGDTNLGVDYTPNKMEDGYAVYSEKLIGEGINQLSRLQTA